MKLPRGLYDFMWEDGYPRDLIPRDSYWAFRWGYQSVRAVRSYRKIQNLKMQGYSRESDEVKDATEQYKADKFACRYGRRGDQEMRIVVAKLEESIPRKKLRSLIRYGDFRKNAKDGSIQIRRHYISAIGAGLYILFCIISFLLMLMMILLGSGSALVKLFLIFGFFAFLLGCASAIYSCALRPYLIVRRIGEYIELRVSEFLNVVRPPKLTLVD